MKPNNEFLNLPKKFWASVRLISQEVGYTEKSTNQIKVPVLDEITSKLAKFNIDIPRLLSQLTESGNFSRILQEYFSYRANIINTFVEPHLMTVAEARKVFQQFHKDL